MIYKKMHILRYEQSLCDDCAMKPFHSRSGSSDATMLVNLYFTSKKTVYGMAVAIYL